MTMSSRNIFVEPITKGYDLDHIGDLVSKAADLRKKA